MQIEGILPDLQVLDLADEKASFCSRLLADLGATVTKVEKPAGDPSRRIGPFQRGLPNPEASLFFSHHNANKQGITLDYEHPEGKEIFFRLVKRSDVVVESFPPGYLKKSGLDFEVLRRINSRLILVSVTGFGQSGPRSHHQSCDLVASGYGGQMFVTGSPRMPPLNSYGGQPCYTASLYAAIGILLALRKRNRTGKGDHLDISMQEVVASTLDHVLVRYFSEGVVARRQGNRSWSGESFITPCRGGHLFVTLSQWETLVGWMASEGMADDLTEERWKQDLYRREHIDHVIHVVGKWTLTHSARELFETAQRMQFPWGPVCSPNEVLRSPQLQAREFFTMGESPETERSVPLLRLPFKLSSALSTAQRPSPSLGQHNVQIYRGELGISGQEMERLSSIGVIGGSGAVAVLPETLFPRAEKVSPPSRAKAGKILDGVRILDFSRILAGPFATRILGDFGAEVIKVQSSKTANGAESNETAYFNAWNRNKRSITLDLSFPEAREIVLELAALSDAVIENFSPRVMANWGLSYERWKEARGDLILLSMSGMGQSGPWKDFVALGPTLQALSGLTYLTSYEKDSPIGIGYAYADIVSGLYAALALLAALEHRDRTGKGRHIDLSEYEAVCAVLGPVLLDAAVNRQQVLPQGNRAADRPAVPHGSYRCLGEDRWCVLSASDEAQWQALCRIMGSPHWVKEERFSTLSNRKAHPEELDRLLEQWTIQTSPEQVARILQEAGVAAGVVQNAEDLANDPQLTGRGFFMKLKHPVLGEILTDRSPIRFEQEDPPEDWKASPLLGADNEYVYRQLVGMTESEVASYLERGILR
jgi:crotonobetainyl-CoA:carnitine CoA-transferase CaiB-like acyl-CoA transferase